MEENIALAWRICTIYLISFETEDEAIELVNDSEFSLASCSYTKDLARVEKVSSALE